MVHFFNSRFAGMVGNILEHYDHALFGLLAPFLAPLFFDQQDPLTALILTYGMLPLGILTRPLGSLFFGWIGDRFGRREALFYSLLTTALATISIGCLPTHADAGIWAPIFLAFARMVQSFCAAGESTGGAIFVLEHTSEKKRSFMSSLYDASSILGILTASALVTFFSAQGIVEEKWRLLFWIGGSSALLGILLRLKTKTEALVSKKEPLLHILKANKAILLSIILLSGFSYTTYSLSFTLMNGFVPLITFLTKADVLKVNTALLVADMLLLPIFGYLAYRFGKEKVMLTALFCSLVGAIPLFSILSAASLERVIGVRLLIMTFGVAFAAPYYAWCIERIAPQHRFRILALGAALGSQLIGMPSSALCLWVYQKTGWVAAPGLYLSLLAGFALFRMTRKKEVTYVFQKDS